MQNGLSQAVGIGAARGANGMSARTGLAKCAARGANGMSARSRFAECAARGANGTSA